MRAVNATVPELIPVASDSVAATPTLTLLVEKAAAKPPRDKSHRSAPAGAFDDQLEWLIRFADAALGASGTLAGVVNQIERGSVGGSGRLDATGAYIQPYTDLQIGTGVSAIGEVEIHRWLMSAWSLVPPRHQMMLCRRYSAPPAQFRSDEGFGAKDKYVVGSDGRSGQHNPTRTGTEAQLGQHAALALELCDDPIQLLIACMEPSPIRKGKTNKAESNRRRALIRECLRRAHEADVEAHAAWFAAKGTVPALRTNKIRTGREHNNTPVIGEKLQVGRAARSGRALRMSDPAFREAMNGALATAGLAAE